MDNCKWIEVTRSLDNPSVHYGLPEIGQWVYLQRDTGHGYKREPELFQFKRATNGMPYWKSVNEGIIRVHIGDIWCHSSLKSHPKPHKVQRLGQLINWYIPHIVIGLGFLCIVASVLIAVWPYLAWDNLVMWFIIGLIAVLVGIGMA